MLSLLRAGYPSVHFPAPRAVLALAIVSWALLAAHPAAAWMEKRIESSTTTLEVARDGTATVRHELLLEVHGAPLQNLTLRGVDSDAEPLPDATVTRLYDNLAAGAPQPVGVRASAGVLEVEVPTRQGLRGTSFILKLGYRTHLLERGLIQHASDGQRSELTWVGPRFEDGVDSVTLIVVADAAPNAPEISPHEARENLGANYGIVMSNLRRSRDHDELELIRAHVARDEAMSWHVLLDRRLFPGASSAAGAGRSSAAEPVLDAALAPSRRSRVYDLLWVVPGGLLYGLLVLLKSWTLARASRARGCTARPWIGASPSVRALAAGLLLAAAASVVSSGGAPLLAAGLLLGVMALAAHRPPVVSPSSSGPGVWQALDAAALVAQPTRGLEGGWLDAGRVRGFLLLGTALGGLGLLAARVFAVSPYAGACILLGSSALLPIFCTGRAGELPLDALNHSRRFLGQVARRLARDGELVIRPIGRLAAQSGELDQLRLSIAPGRPVPGLIGVELGLEFRERLGGFCARPVVVVRAAEGSPCQRALPRGLTWTRGRNAEERACLVRPKLPSVALSVALVQELLDVMLAPPPETPEPVKNASKSSGRGLSTAKPGSRSSPAHAT